MHLINMPKVRVKKYNKGWVVERQYKILYFIRYWKHIESVSGMKDVPWYYETSEVAIGEAKKHFG